jgi:hypothetical protein
MVISRKAALAHLTAVSLLLLGSTAADCADHVPPVFLSHFFVVLDPATFAALTSSPDIGTFAAHEIKDAHGAPTKGFYLYGRRTFMEFFPAGQPPGDPEGLSGLGLAVETSGGVAAIAAKFRRVFGNNVSVETASQELNGQTVSWYTAVDLDSNPSAPFTFWISEFNPGYLAAKYPGLNFDRPLSRESYELPHFSADTMLDEVTGLKMALSPSDAARLVTALRLLGWTIHPKEVGFEAVGPDFRLRVVRARERTGIQQVFVRLRRYISNKNIKLGNANLILRGQSGCLTFWSDSQCEIPNPDPPSRH